MGGTANCALASASPVRFSRANGGPSSPPRPTLPHGVGREKEPGSPGQDATNHRPNCQRTSSRCCGEVSRPRHRTGPKVFTPRRRLRPTPWRPPVPRRRGRESLPLPVSPGNRPMVDSGFTDLSTNVETRELDLSGDVTGVRRSDQERTVPPRQAQQSVVLACGLAGLTEFKEGDVDTVFPERTLDLCLGRAARSRAQRPCASSIGVPYRWELELGCVGRTPSGSRRPRRTY